MRRATELATNTTRCVSPAAPTVSAKTRFDSRVAMRQPALVASSLVQRNKVVAKRKGALAAVTAGATGAIAIAGAPAVLTILGLAGAAYLTWDWFSFRVKNGMRF